MAEKKRKRGGLKGFTQKSGDMRPTRSGAGMTAKGVAKYRRQKNWHMKIEELHCSKNMD